jgi:hypothetical protein
MKDRLARVSLDWRPKIGENHLEQDMDVFKHSISATDGLPPYAQARLIDLISNQLRKAREHPCLWVSVDAPGRWYLEEIKRLVRYRIPTVILEKSWIPGGASCYKPHAFYFYNWDLAYPKGLDSPYMIGQDGIKAKPMRLLRILARLKSAHTIEIASLAGNSKTTVRGLLKELQSRGMIEWKRIGKYDGWAIQTRGMRQAHRSWNVPKGAHFAQYRGEVRYSGERHKRVSRLWRAWLEAAYPHVEIWESWTEVLLQRGIPDALAWGQAGGEEILFWLEVDSGHSSRQVMAYRYIQRLTLAVRHAYRWNIKVVFCIMGPPWVVKAFARNLDGYFWDHNFAIIGHDWRDFGTLPAYEFGRWREDLDATQSCLTRRAQFSEGLSFDPEKYPRKSKKRERTKQSKEKSNKPRYVSPNYDDELLWESDPNDR